jgi:hypothetical protein
MNPQVNETMNRAIQAEVKPPVWDRITGWVREQGGWTLLFVACMLALLIGITMLESTNSAAGWVKLTTGAVPSWLAWLAGFALPIGYVGFHRRAMEHWREVKRSSAFRAAIVAILAMTASLIGVFANISSETEKSATEAMKNNTERAALYADIQAIKTSTSDERLFQLQALLQVTESTIKSVEAEAVGWNLYEDRVVDGESVRLVATAEQCGKNLRPRARTLCNRLNGDGGDEMGLRNEVFLHQASLDGIERQRSELAEKQAAYRNMDFKDGGAHWSAMATIASGSASSDFIRIWGALAVAFIFLLIAGFGWDEFFERTEAEIGVDI